LEARLSLANQVGVIDVIRQLAIVADVIASAIGHMFYLLICWVLGHEPIMWIDGEDLAR